MGLGPLLLFFTKHSAAAHQPDLPTPLEVLGNWISMDRRIPSQLKAAILLRGQRRTEPRETVARGQNSIRSRQHIHSDSCGGPCGWKPVPPIRLDLHLLSFGHISEFPSGSGKYPPMSFKRIRGGKRGGPTHIGPCEAAWWL